MAIVAIVVFVEQSNSITLPPVEESPKYTVSFIELNTPPSAPVVANAVVDSIVLSEHFITATVPAEVFTYTLFLSVLKIATLGVDPIAIVVITVSVLQLITVIIEPEE